MSNTIFKFLKILNHIVFILRFIRTKKKFKCIVNYLKLEEENNANNYYVVIFDYLP